MISLFDHQKKALADTASFRSCAYYLDMGLGKTFVGSEKMKQLNNKINVLICQKSKVSDWTNHFRENYPTYIVYDLTDGSSKNKQNLEDMWYRLPYKAFPAPMIMVINYDLAWRRLDLKKLHDFTLMLDESSLISNECAKRSRFILSMHPSSVILLSGTPVAGKYEQLWSQCKLLGWNIKKSEFWSNYILTRPYDVGNFVIPIVVGYKNVDHLKSKLAEYGAVFMKSEDVLTLPDQLDQSIMIQPSSAYKKFKKNRYVQISEGEFVGDNSLTQTLYERQLCGSYSSEKLEAFKDLVDSTGDRLIVFYNYTEELKKLKECLPANRKISVVNGREKNLANYDKYRDSITFVQYQAGAMGLNLQKANKVVYFTLPLGKGSCDLWEQSKKRIHRIGQDRTCFYYYLLVANSIEEKNLKALREGKELTDALFEN